MVGKAHVLVFNAGSSSLKVELYTRQPELRSCLRGTVRDIGRGAAALRFVGFDAEQTGPIATHADAAELVLDRLAGGTYGRRVDAEDLAATGHRVVHGGDEFFAPLRITPSVVDTLESLAELAPLHNPPSLGVIDAVARALPGVPMVAAFDTAWFRDLPDYVSAYAIPQSWAADHAIRRYGFHGIAHEYMYRRLDEIGQPAPSRIVTLQLGQGCSATALRDGRPVETSMGFTPLEGLVMGTRPGDLDAGVLLHRARRGFSWQAIERELNRSAGLLGLSGVSGDMRDLVELEAEQHAGATLAVAAFCHRVRKYVGAYAAVLGGLDALAFGGGIGENTPIVRERICRGLEWLGLELDSQANAAWGGAERRISTSSSSIDVRVIEVNEERLIAEAALGCLGSDAAR
jgi:acetate kinase